MIQTLLSLLKQWKPFLKDWRIINQGQLVAEWVNVMTQYNVLETLHVRTLPFRTPGGPTSPSPLNNNLGLKTQ
jgi:hypothetical protein